MAWVKLEDGVVEHRKHLQAGPAACWLWVCGIAYCQRQLTNGFIPTEAIALLGVARGVKPLLAALVRVGLFDVVDGGFQVHDYLHHNSTKEEALKRRDDQHAAKVKAGLAGSRARWQNDSRPIADADSRTMAPSHPIPSPPIPKEQKSARVLGPINGTLDQDLANRAGAFCERYAELYPQHRKGARYLPKPALDFPKACELCAVWDNDRLERLAIVFLKCEEPFAQQGSRTIGQFAAMASWADGRLREVEAAS